MSVEPATTFCSNPTPLPNEQCSSEQVRPDIHSVITPLVPFRTDSCERRVIRKQRKLDRLVDQSSGSAGRHREILTPHFGLNSTIRAADRFRPRKVTESNP